MKSTRARQGLSIAATALSLRCATKGELCGVVVAAQGSFPAWGTHEGSHGEGCGMRYVIGDSARFVTPYRGYS